MTNELIFFLIALGGGIVGIAATTIYHFRAAVAEKQYGPFSVHGWYTAGILGFLLICVVASNWGAIPGLATILSFAVGLASLLLALVAIIQSLTSTSSFGSTLGAIRQAANDVSSSGNQLAVSIKAIQQAADQAGNAAASAMDATRNIADRASTLVQSSEANRLALNALRDEVKSRFIANPSTKGTQSSDGKTNSIFRHGISFGGAALAYAAIRSFDTEKPIDRMTLYNGEAIDKFGDGYISALDDLGFLKVKRDTKTYKIEKLDDRLRGQEETLRLASYSSTGTQEKQIKRIAAIDEYFESTTEQ